MLRIAGVDIPENKKVDIALSYIYGIGPSLAQKILKQCKIDLNIKAKDLKEEEIIKVRKIIEKDYKVEGQLRQEIKDNIKRLRDIRCWRGLRHEKRLPVRGQQTRTNSRTVRGNVRVTASGTTYRRSQPSPT